MEIWNWRLWENSGLNRLLCNILMFHWYRIPVIECFSCGFSWDLSNDFSESNWDVTKWLLVFQTWTLQAHLIFLILCYPKDDHSNKILGMWWHWVKTAPTRFTDVSAFYMQEVSLNKVCVLCSQPQSHWYFARIVPTVILHCISAWIIDNCTMDPMSFSKQVTNQGRNHES